MIADAEHIVNYLTSAQLDPGRASFGVSQLFLDINIDCDCDAQYH